jgi:hypothetical protein
MIYPEMDECRSTQKSEKMVKGGNATDGEGPK